MAFNGTAANFGHPLSRLDAAYFEFGIFVTAGTSPIAPQSEFARRLVTIQYVVDIPFTLLVLALVVSRLLAGLDSRHRKN